MKSIEKLIETLCVIVTIVFFLAVAAMVAGQAVAVVTLNGDLAVSFEAMGPNAGWCIAIGFVVAALSGLFAIKVMVNAIKKANYKWFSLYLVLLAIACIVLYCTGVL